MISYMQYGDITRGDIIVYTSGTALYCKRLIGLPGDEIIVRSGVLYINGQPVPKKRIGDYVHPEFSKASEFEEALPNGIKHRVLDTLTDGEFDNGRPFVVPPGHYFVLGDNRDNSVYSRAASHGFVQARNVLGRVIQIQQ